MTCEECEGAMCCCCTEWQFDPDDPEMGRCRLGFIGHQESATPACPCFSTTNEECRHDDWDGEGDFELYGTDTDSPIAHCLSDILFEAKAIRTTAADFDHQCELDIEVWSHRRGA